MKFFSRNNPFVKEGVSVTKIGEKYTADNGEQHGFWRASTVGLIEKEILSYSYRAKKNNHALKVVVLVHHQDIVRSDSKGISAEIDKLIQKAKELNNAGGFAFGANPLKVVDYVCVLPQVKKIDDMTKMKKTVVF